ncbi:hypothetical protein [Burkholderia phage vB_BpP_HN04]|nr:hypothetical protein [Burkholderia phage vB_BpP_HN01]
MTTLQLGQRGILANKNGTLMCATVLSLGSNYDAYRIDDQKTPKRVPKGTKTYKFFVGESAVVDASIWIHTRGIKELDHA